MVQTTRNKDIRVLVSGDSAQFVGWALAHAVIIYLACLYDKLQTGTI